MTGVERQRLTREEQRERTISRLLDSAEALFVRDGIPDTSIEDIAENAGYSRGAFYSNFDGKDELVVRLIERQQDHNIGETNDIVDSTDDGDEMLDRLLDWSRGLNERGTAISTEYVLYASRKPELRGQMKALGDRLLAQHAHIIRSQHDALDIEMPISPEDGARILLALDEGFALLRLNDPDSYPPHLWADTVAFLNEAVIALAEKRAREQSTQD